MDSNGCAILCVTALFLPLMKRDVVVLHCVLRLRKRRFLQPFEVKFYLLLRQHQRFEVDDVSIEVHLSKLSRV